MSWLLLLSYEVSLDNPTVLQSVKDQLDYIMDHIDENPVIQFSSFPAWYKQKDPNDPNSKASAMLANLIDAVVGTGIKGLILQSYGEGNFPSGDPDTPQDGAIYPSPSACQQSRASLL